MRHYGRRFRSPDPGSGHSRETIQLRSPLSGQEGPAISEKIETRRSCECLATYRDWRILVAFDVVQGFPVSLNEELRGVVLSAGLGWLSLAWILPVLKTYMKPVPRLAIGCMGDAAAISWIHSLLSQPSP